MMLATVTAAQKRCCCQNCCRGRAWCYVVAAAAVVAVVAQPHSPKIASLLLAEVMPSLGKPDEGPGEVILVYALICVVRMLLTRCCS